MTGLRIIELISENVKRISVVQIKPDANIVEISGLNGQGKSSVLDSIEMALAGADAVPTVPIRKGSKSARVQVTLGDGGIAALIVERKFTQGGNRAGYLSITTPDGMQPLKAQTMLDGLLGALSMDPLEFMRMDGAKQYEVAKKLAPIPVDLDALDGQRAVLYESRADANKNAKRHQASADTITFPNDLPETAPDVAAITAELADVDRYNSLIRNRHREKEDAQRVLDHRCKIVDDAQRALEAAQQALEAARALCAEATANLATVLSVPVPELKDASEIKTRLVDAQATARYCGVRDRKREFEEDAAAERTESEKLTADIAAIDKAKADGLAAAVMPVEGLAFGEGEVLYQGLPLSQASDAERLLVSTRMAAALNPKLRVIRIRDGSLLDANSMKALEEFAAAQDLQIWIERVSTGTGVIIEDGHVKGQEELVAAHAAKEKAMEDEGLPKFVDGQGSDAIKYRSEMAAAVETAPSLDVLAAYRKQAKRRLEDFGALWRELNGVIMAREKYLSKK